MNFKVGDIVTVTDATQAFVDYVGTSAEIVEITSGLYRLAMPDGRYPLYYDNEIELAKNHIIYNIIQEL